MKSAAQRLAELVESILGEPLPIAIQAWDGSRAGPVDGPAMIVRSRRAMKRLIWRPDEIGLARGWVAGDIDVDGSLEEAMSRLDAMIRRLADAPRQSLRERLRAARIALLLGAVGTEPSPPPEEVALVGRRHSKRRDQVAVRHHYDVGNEFYSHVLGPSMTYSCAYWADDDYTLEDAQRAKNDLICRKLGLSQGDRLLDVGCGWGALVIHAAKEYGVSAVGVTLSPEQAKYARQQLEDEGVDHQIEVRVQDWRDIADGPFDAIASVGMAEHLGAETWDEYVTRLYGMLRPGGRLLNHQIVRIPSRNGPRVEGQRTFIDAYVFPDGELIPIGDVVSLLEAGGFEVRDVHGLREHYARTLRAWVSNLDAAWDRAVELAGSGRARVWTLYMTASAIAFDAGRIGVDQVLAVRMHSDGHSGIRPVRPA
jgi:cyclopropane-fatty-acyl-phospholipid synthase